MCGTILIVLHLKQHLLLDKICDKDNIDWAQTQHDKCCEKCPVGSSSSSVIFAVSQSVNGLCSPPQALFRCVELLEDQSVDDRICGCKASACLKVEAHRALI